MSHKQSIWMPFYIGDYLRDTMHLAREDHGSYILLILAYWVNQGPLRDDDRFLAGTAKCTLKLWVKSSRAVMLQYFTVEGGLWHHKRIDKELEVARGQSQKQSENARKRWGKRGMPPHQSGIALACANDMPNACPSQSPSQVHSLPEVAWPAWAEWWLHCQKIGLAAEWKARDEWEKQESKHWRGIEQWQNHANRVKAWWEADGRPMKSKGNQHGTRKQNHSEVDRNAGTTNAGRAEEYEGAAAKTLLRMPQQPPT